MNVKVILLKDVPKIGQKGEVREVADGYAFNFLIPKNLAKTATGADISNIEQEKKQKSAKREHQITVFIDNLNKVKSKTVEIIAKVNEKGHLFKGLREKDISEAVKKATGITIEPEFIQLEGPIKESGEREIKIEGFGQKTSIKILIQEKKS